MEVNGRRVRGEFKGFGSGCLEERARVDEGEKGKEGEDVHVGLDADWSLLTEWYPFEMEWR